MFASVPVCFAKVRFGFPPNADATFKMITTASTAADGDDYDAFQFVL